LILVDSSVWIDFLSASPGRAGNELRRMIAGSEQFAITGIVVSEVLQGLSRNVPAVEKLLSLWTFLEPQGFSTYREAAAVFRLARAKGVSVTTVDALIAAMALEYRARLFTLDQDFFRIARLTPLQLYTPAQPSTP
jgi:predicted nucleic acid-binding protein